MEHADYPHWPGALYDCSACESECNCESLSAFTLCVSCEQEEC